jgi:hypothetical protein
MASRTIGYPATLTRKIRDGNSALPSVAANDSRYLDNLFCGVPDMKDRPLYVAIATALNALANCRSDSANESQRAYSPRWIEFIQRASWELPRGSGFDRYPVVDTDDIKSERIKITGSFHTMDSNGYYTGWIDYTVTVLPSLTSGFTFRIVGGDLDWKDYAYDCFQTALAREFPHDAFYTCG